MENRQLNLFAGLIQEEKNNYHHEMVPSPAPTKYSPFLPGVIGEEAFLDITDCNCLHDTAQQCQKCHLRSTCSQVVFGQGNINAQVMLVGEGPGGQEDQQGVPFVGKAGQLLDKILKAAEFKREDVYITNVVKCRPPSNRLPHPDEVKICRNYLEAEIRLIKPQIIVCLGSLASQTVIDSRARITKIRGQWLWRDNIRIMATFHPAALLRNESYKRPTWEDFKKIRDESQKLK